MPTSPARLRCLVVDDNEINRLTLEHFVEMTDALELVASLPDAVQALNLLRSGTAIDLLFLDIEMPLLSGLDLVRALPDPQPEVVLVTTHADFAVAAFELAVADYLVKPVDYGRFSKAVARVLAQRAATAAPAQPEGTSATEGSELFVKVNNKLVKLDFNDVLYIEAMSTYSVFVTPKHKHIVYITLKALEDRLPFSHFVRVHRSFIVNTKRIEAVEDNQLLLGDHEIPVGKSYQEEFFRKLRSL
ncbi:LytR/AlgR family response regulator transcription factor [Hymenobacter chitinivorans]|uniref:DNA-binding LytR/AlgR family response regulator n=1 Tax=Hymenobacter chitinivorans DSM 11115 TaxID=1121954 RepID=A0A2M9BAC5_9BACT|nr:LytTR family DNA-binding domain-containing protein [Hymenobacter chitinivorans]PJJ54898.1 DNA-binding LytR/AlgR family response regulator [Hymenobacter chitinivorans DSM 11115]